jgi:protein arginine kinase activator
VSLCDSCGEREAVIHLTQIVDNSVTTLHLCEPCAAEKGVDTVAQVAKYPLGDFLASLGEAASPAPGSAAAAGAAAACPRCGATLQDFRQTGRLGCAACYVTFEAPLRDLLRRVHGNTQHQGEQYRSPGEAAGAEAPGGGAAVTGVGALKDRLRRAVEAEDFEEAARLRDAIRRLE